MKEGIAAGELDERFDSRELTIAWYGLMNVYAMGQVLQPEISYTEKTARSVVDLFFNGADAKGKKKGPARSKR
jgi:hypothetical protein